MFEAQLFLGVEIDDQLAHFLEMANPNLVSMLIQKESYYLQKVSFQGQPYLGKFVGKVGNLPQLELIELNIRSLLKKLAPEYPTHQLQFKILPCLESQYHFLEANSNQ